MTDDMPAGGRTFRRSHAAPEELRCPLCQRRLETGYVARSRTAEGNRMVVSWVCPGCGQRIEETVEGAGESRH